jgi:hypothetical protein
LPSYTPEEIYSNPPSPEKNLSNSKNTKLQRENNNDYEWELLFSEQQERKKAQSKIIEENLNEGAFKVSDIFPYQNTLVLGEDIIKKHKIDELNFFNINTIKDYAFFQNKYNEQKESFPQYWKKTFFR